MPLVEAAPPAFGQDVLRAKYFEKIDYPYYVPLFQCSDWSNCWRNFDGPDRVWLVLYSIFWFNCSWGKSSLSLYFAYADICVKYINSSEQEISYQDI